MSEEKKTEGKSEDRNPTPPDDVIYDVLPKKWKKGPKGTHYPDNYPMNPNGPALASYPTVAMIFAGAIKEQEVEKEDLLIHIKQLDEKVDTLQTEMDHLLA